MTADERLLSELCVAVAARLHVGSSQIDADADIVMDLGLESHEVLAFLIEVEQQYPPVVFEEIEAGDIRTIRELARHVSERQAL